jgi:asparagine synthase (glutamine-hydrolysing)
VDFSLHLPPHDKVSRTRLRCFFRAAVTGYLPDAVISKQKRGFGLPFGIWASQPGELRECVFDLLGSARRRGIVAAALIDDLTGGLLDREPRYYGPLVWLIIVLESWLSENT